MIGALMLLPFLAFCLWLGAASVRPGPRVTSARRRPSRAEPELIETPIASTPMPAWTDLDELQLTRLLRDESPPATPPGAVG
jgi:hypothetical protein